MKEKQEKEVATRHEGRKERTLDTQKNGSETEMDKYRSEDKKGWR